LRKHFREELKHGRERTASKIKALIWQHAQRGSLRAAIYLADRLCDLPAPRFRDPEDMPPPSQVTVIIKGGLPATIEPDGAAQDGPADDPESVGD
jgi:hypothetical protein